jgi:hypothetical protein
MQRSREPKISALTSVMSVMLPISTCNSRFRTHFAIDQLWRVALDG